MKKVLLALAAVSGILLAALGGLWALQGADLVHLEPIACVADCEPLEGFSTTWLVAGIVLLLAGLMIAWKSTRKLLRVFR
jgi:hypothetical protein